MAEIKHDFDLLEMPVEGVAAYWLSLKKLVGNKRNFKRIHEEAQHTSEEYIRYLLETGFGNFSEETKRKMANAKAQTMLSAMERKFDCMRIAVLDVATVENPHRSVAKIYANFPQPPVQGDKAIRYAQELLRLMPDKYKGRERFFDVGYKVPDDKLIVALLFYVFYARHQGKDVCQSLLPLISSAYFRDALSMVIDGFDVPFVRKWLKKHKEVLLRDLEYKCTMSTELCMGIASRMDYEDLHSMARAYLPSNGGTQGA
ncbi:hypothetical protein [Halodesulfovibrio sp.]|jgi:hypothetical protein|uniref:hypothetical protein n=1 Tax=Halodesulfovibrio sp. TaxID=1912772 RepID=UPI0025F0B3E4|nr:hypothetical protein [Halodesulfovibrio sp.]MCT4628245.1 hypothetical protein [Halodesulfovibrio sp.]